MTETPILVTTEELDDHLDSAEVRVVDLSKLEHYAFSHIPGAIHLDYVTLLDGNKPAPGRLPPGKQLEQLSSVLGLSNGYRIIACDDEGSGRAARLVWTLHVMGYPSCSVLDGGMTAWRKEQRRLTAEQPLWENTAPRVAMDNSVIATREYILAHLNDNQVSLVDARTREEYIGAKQLSSRSGHIPGAVNLNWLDTIDTNNHLRLKPRRMLKDILEARQILPAREVITYCQTHHRSAHTWMLLKSLGYPTVRGYPGSWSEWGNDPETPIQTLSEVNP